MVNVFGRVVERWLENLQSKRIVLRYSQELSRLASKRVRPNRGKVGDGGLSESWYEWLNTVHQEGKEKVPNPNPDTRKQYPEVEYTTALKNKSFRDKAYKEYKEWLDKQEETEWDVEEKPKDKPEKTEEEEWDVEETTSKPYSYEELSKLPTAAAIIEHVASSLEKRPRPEELERPVGKDEAEYKKIVADRLSKATEESKKAIRQFTSDDYKILRPLEQKSKKEGEEYLAKQKTKLSYQDFEEWSGNMEQAFRDVPPMPSKVYRGLNNVGRDKLAKLMTDEVINIGGTSSSSRRPYVAHSFADTITTSAEGKVGVMLVLEQKSGIGIEAISDLEDECEILLPKDTEFRVTNRYLDETDTLHIEAEETTEKPFYKGK